MTEKHDTWEPREHDHLVEPVFGGLGVREEERRVRPEASVQERRGLVARFFAWLGLG